MKLLSNKRKTFGPDKQESVTFHPFKMVTARNSCLLLLLLAGLDRFYPGNQARYLAIYLLQLQLRQIFETELLNYRDSWISFLIRLSTVSSSSSVRKADKATPLQPSSRRRFSTNSEKLCPQYRYVKVKNRLGYGSNTSYD